jgi:hypothetical protein
MNTKQIIAPSLLALALLTVTRAQDCEQYCNHGLLPETETTGPPGCQMVIYSGDIPVCAAIPEAEPLRNRPRLCIFVEGEIKTISWVLYKATFWPDENGGYCDEDYERSSSGSFDVPDCRNVGKCAPIEV